MSLLLKSNKETVVSSVAPERRCWAGVGVGAESISVCFSVCCIPSTWRYYIDLLTKHPFLVFGLVFNITILFPKRVTQKHAKWHKMMEDSNLFLYQLVAFSHAGMWPSYPDSEGAHRCRCTTCLWPISVPRLPFSSSNWQAKAHAQCILSWWEKLLIFFQKLHISTNSGLGGCSKVQILRYLFFIWGNCLICKLNTLDEALFFKKVLLPRLFVVESRKCL